jgi:hypothetical protein
MKKTDWHSLPWMIRSNQMRNINTIKQWLVISLGDNWLYILAGVVALALVMLTSLGCNETVPVTRMNADQCQTELVACEASEDAAWAEVATWEAQADDAMLTPDTTRVVQQDTDPATTDTDALAQCELERSSWTAETSRVGDKLETCVMQQDNLKIRYHDVLSAVQAVPADVAEYMCSVGNWKGWICESLGYEGVE